MGAQLDGDGHGRGEAPPVHARSTLNDRNGSEKKSGAILGPVGGTSGLADGIYAASTVCIEKKNILNT